MLRRLPCGEVPDLAQLVGLTRLAVIDELGVLTTELIGSADTDMAVFTGVVVHGPASDSVAPSTCLGELWRRPATGDTALLRTIPAGSRAHR